MLTYLFDYSNNLGAIMTTKEKVKREIDKIPDYLLEDVLRFISKIKIRENSKGKVHTFRLNGKFDNLNIRTKAYE